MVTMILGALAIGLTLGLLGSGGSILTVPVLVYLLGHHDKVAIAESLAIVGGISLIGMLPYARAKQVDWKSVLFFGLPGMGGTYIGAWLAKFMSGPAQLVLFGVVMLVAAAMMLRKSKPISAKTACLPGSSGLNENPRAHPLWQIVLEGLLVGILTGLVGVGGGFLIVPALVILGGLPMRLAVGTSLMIIAMKSFSGFFKYVGVLSGLHLSVDWNTIGIFLLVGVVGTIIGNVINQRINQQVMRKVFAGFLVAMAVFVLAREIPHVLHNQDAPPAAHALEATRGKPDRDPMQSAQLPAGRVPHNTVSILMDVSKNISLRYFT
ncbi:MAG: sulfite exporter TauE/SafE family protein [Planctomycetaceae bacterium]|nr:sulfite exporter TauE/SafE family protein [Planctomycetaceae bacterium]